MSLALAASLAAAQSTAPAPPAAATGDTGPVLRVFPRPGDYFVPPTGPGTYSLVDELRGVAIDGPPQSGYPSFAVMAPPFFDADFRYLDARPVADRRWFERLKRVRTGDHLVWSTGGSAWYRLQDERHSRLTRVDQTDSLPSLRTYLDVAYGDRVRAYGELVSAARWGGSLPVLPSDSDHLDLLDAFADVKLSEVRGHRVEIRVGRQELLLGSQRLISPLPWANVRRNFDGVRVFRQGARVDVDAFLVAPVAPNRTGFDRTDTHAQLAGLWLTYRPRAGRFVDLYALYSDNSHAVVQQGLAIAPARLTTTGGRYTGDRRGTLWDVEGAVQAGTRAEDHVLAGMATAGVGRHFAAPSSPTIWVYYDWASGDGDPGDSRSTTFNQLYPFGHYYLGWLDVAGRQNIRDANVQFIVYPRPWVTLWLQYHHLWLDAAADALYNAGGSAIRRDASGGSGANVGGDADVVVNLHVDAQSDVLLAWAQTQAGTFMTDTAGPSAAASGRTFSLIYNFRW